MEIMSLRIINEMYTLLKYERILAEGNTEGKEQTNAEGCLNKSPLDNEKKESTDPDKYTYPYNYWFKFKLPILWERFNNETSQMDHEWKLKKWYVDFQMFSNKKFNDLLYPIIRSNIPDKQKKEKIDRFMNEFDSEFNKFLCECKKDMTNNKTESESKKEITGNKTESEYKKEMTDNKKEYESKNEMTDKKTESKSMNEVTDNKTESKSKEDMRENTT
ncbi:fam-g protein [Plasmodium gallinaceum]|uniref:Fam-g protein n=1 Tax=Plasmodium gallinaceum TaxID=5849 RepID=A0A1J1GYE1_PLAGA|nr:fam-g protein [Plasmodium gallinaceum]CRG96024.1 fam-g protein [Plasmodium gallinaceum]